MKKTQTSFFPAEVSSILKTFTLKLINPTTHLPSQTPEHFLNTKVTAIKSRCGLADFGELTSQRFQLKHFASPLCTGLGACSCCTSAIVQLQWCSSSLQPCDGKALSPPSRKVKCNLKNDTSPKNDNNLKRKSNHHHLPPTVQEMKL